MTDRKKLTNQLDGKTQIADGSIDELLLDAELREKIALIGQLEKRLTKLELSLGNVDDADFVAAYKGKLTQETPLSPL